MTASKRQDSVDLKIKNFGGMVGGTLRNFSPGLLLFCISGRIFWFEDINLISISSDSWSIKIRRSR